MKPLRHKKFRRLLAGQALSSLALSALYLALGIWAKDLTHSNALAGSVFLALGAPALLGPLLGSLVDRVRRGPLLVLTNAVLAAVVLALLGVHGRGGLWLLFAVAAACGVATTLVNAGRSGLLRELLSEAELGPANALLQTATQGLRLLSPLLGAGIYTLLGGHGLALVDAALLALAALTLASVRVAEGRPERDPDRRFVREVLAGFAHVRSVPLLAQLAVVGSLAFAVVGLSETVVFAVVDEGLHRSPSFLGVVDTVQGAGAILGGVACPALLRRFGEGRTAGIGLLAVAVGALASAVPSLGPVLAGTLVFGLGVPWFVVGWATAMTRHTPGRLQGRVTASANLLLTGPQTVSIALGAVLITVVDYRVLLLVITGGMAVSGGILLLRPAPAPAPVPVTGVVAARPAS